VASNLNDYKHSYYRAKKERKSATSTYEFDAHLEEVSRLLNAYASAILASDS
jgi:hypothetical protein